MFRAFTPPRPFLHVHLFIQGPGTSMAFALRLVDLLCGPDKAKEVAGGLLVPYP